MKAIFEHQKYEIDIHIAPKINAYPPMFHEHMELVYVIEGQLTLQIDGNKRTLTPGQMAMVFPYVVHSYEKETDCRIYLLMFPPTQTGLFEKELHSCKPRIPYLDQAQHYLPFFEKIEDYAHSESLEKRKLAASYLSTFVGELLVTLPMTEAAGTDFSMAQKLLAYCSEHYTEPITVKSAASHLFVSESYVSKLFSQKLGCSFREYINSLRALEAKRLLKHSDMKIVDIMLHCGFQNQSSFNRVFLETYGMTPREYRRSNSTAIS